MMSGQRRTDQEWQLLFSEFESGEQTAKAFCAARGLSTSNFFKRRRSITRRVSQAFVPARVTVGNSMVTLQVNDVAIRCTTDTSPAWLAQVVTALRR